jgi:protein gp37
LARVSAIEWTDATWNPVRGCTKISPGCKHCYAERFAERFRGVVDHPFADGFDLRLVPEKLDEPLRWRRPLRIFVNSMSDLFHDEIPDSYVRAVFDVMARAPWHSFQLLTKRSDRLRELGSKLPWGANVWAGVSVESREYVGRVDDLRSTPAKTRFLSVEPLLGPIPDLPLDAVDWVIVGGESGPGARPMNLEWVRSIRDQCRRARVPIFLKQLGGRSNKRGGEQAKLDGSVLRELPRHFGQSVQAQPG